MSTNMQRQLRPKQQFQIGRIEVVLKQINILARSGRDIISRLLVWYKDNQGNKADTSNYRGITISPISSKLFEHILKIIFAASLNTSQYPFGFKRKSSTSNAIRCLCKTIMSQMEAESSAVFWTQVRPLIGSSTQAYL